MKTNERVLCCVFFQFFILLIFECGTEKTFCRKQQQQQQQPENLCFEPERHKSNFSLLFPPL